MGTFATPNASFSQVPQQPEYLFQDEPSAIPPKQQYPSQQIDMHAAVTPADETRSVPGSFLKTGPAGRGREGHASLSFLQTRP